MKKLALLGMASLLLLTLSCKKTDTNDGRFRATTETHSDNSKTGLNDKKVLWKNGDNIRIFSQTYANGRLFTTTDDGDKASFSQAGSDPLPENFFTSPYTAFYPDIVTHEGSAFTISLPATQTWAENSFGSGANPMATESDDTNLGFKNICGLLKLQLTSETPCQVKSITITGGNDQPLCGTGTVTFDSDGIPSLSGLTGGKELTLNCMHDVEGRQEGVELSTSSSSPTLFYFVVPDGTLGQGFTMKVAYVDNDYVWTKTTEKDNHVTRNAITRMPEATVETEEAITATVTLAANDAYPYSVTGNVAVSAPTTCEYGVVYKESSGTGDPTESDYKFTYHLTSDDPISGDVNSFDASAAINDLAPGTYKVRAYATLDESDYTYSSTIATVTIPEPHVVPEVSLTEGFVNGHGTVKGTITIPSGTHQCEYGYVYSNSSATPTTSDTKIVVHQMNAAAISGTQVFNIDLSQLSTGTKYIRIYAICDNTSYDPVYSTAKATYSTSPMNVPSNWIDGKNPHRFKVTDSKSVCFSQGNLQYCASGASQDAAYYGANVGGTWQFATYQFDIIGTANQNVSYGYSGWIDLFGWGCSGYNHNFYHSNENKTCYRPWDSNPDNNKYWAYALLSPDGIHNVNAPQYMYNLTADLPGIGVVHHADWGSNTISNGGASSGPSGDGNWRTPTGDEWRGILAKNKHGKCKINDRVGLIILPADWDNDYPFNEGALNEYTYYEWHLMETQGAVFLPIAGGRLETTFNPNNENGKPWGMYWASTLSGVYVDLLVIQDDPSKTFAGTTALYPSAGISVRLVKD